MDSLLHAQRDKITDIILGFDATLQSTLLGMLTFKEKNRITAEVALDRLKESSKSLRDPNASPLRILRGSRIYGHRSQSDSMIPVKLASVTSPHSYERRDSLA
jgi:hypothetical protein